jgi:hypothetical protein
MDSGLVGLRKGKPQDAGVRSGGELGADAVVCEGYGVISALRDLAAVVVTASPAFAWMVRPAGRRFESADHRHGHEVSKVAVPADAAHAGVAETLDRGVLVRVAWGIVSARHGVGSELDHTEGCCRPGECLPLAQLFAGASSDERVNRIGVVLSG